MNYCSNCGNKLDENKVCSVCSENFDKKEEFSNSVNNTNIKKSNTLAVVGFVISLVSLLCCGITSIFGLIFSIIGLCEAKKYDNNGKALAISGICISAILIVLLFLLYLCSIFSISFLENINDNGIDIKSAFETMIIK